MRRCASDVHDEWLVIRSQAGEATALRELGARWHRRLYRHARLLVDRADAAEDATQEAWLAIVRGVRRLDDPARFGPWAYAIVTNKCRDWVRKRARQGKNAFSDEALEDVTNMPDERDAQDYADDAHDEIRKLRLAMRKLSPTHRAALALHYLDDMNIADIAAALGIPVGTVKSRLHHARAKLRAILERSEHHERV